MKNVTRVVRGGVKRVMYLHRSYKNNEIKRNKSSMNKKLFARIDVYRLIVFRFRNRDKAVCVKVRTNGDIAIICFLAK